jgi:hypothetical protein
MLPFGLSRPRRKDGHAEYRLLHHNKDVDPDLDASPGDARRESATRRIVEPYPIFYRRRTLARAYRSSVCIWAMAFL